ncbi:SRPBCC domain-containing protein [Sphingobacterium humi]|uniref:ATPase n=1 Tax=Sphingobacterium humi TaxID=1796905 RepID=A0A6N8L5T3_9SPHI|nr:SRPBCC domain-containing protein [Sphingobacterium humi]MVZ63538.1 ATPase [Sphingobacterium humi]
MKEFKKYYIIPASPEELYRALTTEITIRLWTGDLVEIDPRPEGEFSLWDGAIQGKFLELEPYSKIVQQWYFGEQEEASIVTLKLHVHKKGTSFEVKQTNIPEEDYNDMVDGWNDTYIASLLEFYEEDEE